MKEASSQTIQKFVNIHFDYYYLFPLCAFINFVSVMMSSNFFLLLCIGLLTITSGFFVNSQTSSGAKSSTLLAAEINPNFDSKSEFVSRRCLGVQASSAILATIGLSAQPALADEGKQGRLIEFTVENLGGEAGNSGKIVIKTNPEWAPNGVERFEKLTEAGFWNDIRIFRVLPNFIVSFSVMIYCKILKFGDLSCFSFDIDVSCC